MKIYNIIKGDEFIDGIKRDFLKTHEAERVIKATITPIVKLINDI